MIDVALGAQLRAAAELAPAGVSLVVPREMLLAILPGTDAVAPAGVDFTVGQVAARFGRSKSAVRGWIQSGQLAAYKLAGREYRVTEAAIVAFTAGQQEARSGPARRPRKADLGAWRREPVP